MERSACVYILSNQNHTIFYTGVAKEWQRTQGARERPPLKLVYAERWPTLKQAAMRAEELRRIRILAKIAVISAANPEWRDFSDDPEAFFRP